MARDRVFINSNYRALIEDMKQNDILGFSMVENKDSFMLAVAMGIDHPKTLKNRDGWYLKKNIKTNDKALLSSVLLGTAKNDDEIDSFADLDKVLDLCEECAESGFKELENKINEAGKDTEILERRLMKELDLLYMKNVEADI